MRKIIACLLAVALGPCLTSAQTLKDAADMADSLLAAQQYSRAKSFIRICFHDLLTDEMVASPTLEQCVLTERLCNDLREAEIKTGSFFNVYKDFATGNVRFESPKEYLRFFHLNSLWLRCGPARAIYEDGQCDSMNLACTKKALTEFQRLAGSVPDSQSVLRTIWDDLLIAYGDIGDGEGCRSVLDMMSGSVEGICSSCPDWPYVYWHYKALLCNDEQKELSRMILKDVLFHALDDRIDFVVNPWLKYVLSEAEAGHFQEVHDVSEYVFRRYRMEDERQLVSMSMEDRYAIAESSLIRNYAFLPKLPEGTFEDILYDAVLFSKSIRLDIDRSIADYVYASNDPSLIYEYETMNYLSCGPDSWYSSFLFQEMYDGKHLEPSIRDYSWKAVERNLGDRDVAVEFVRTGQDYTEMKALVLRRGWSRPILVDIGSDQAFAGIQADARTHREQAKSVGRLVLGPLLEYVSAGDNLYYSADGVISQLNLDALSLSDGTMAGERYHIHRVTSTLDINRGNTDGYDAVIAFGGMDYFAPADIVTEESALFHQVYPMYMQEWSHGNDSIASVYSFGWIENDRKEERSGYGNLKYSGDEVASIAQAWGKKHGCYIYRGNKAVEEAFKYWGIRDTLPSKSIIHLATHSVSREIDLTKYWMLSRKDEDFKREGLLFTGAKTVIEGRPFPSDKMNDGILWGEEIAALDLRNADLVVLSACHTARGTDSLDGVLGLQRAFKQAGAKTILMSLWRVNDKATMIFMSTFYKALLEGKSKYESYKTAQAAVRERYSGDPYYWAPFILLD